MDNFAPTLSQKQALLWLRQRGGHGILKGDLASGGEYCPLCPSVWTGLKLLGLVTVKGVLVTISKKAESLPLNDLPMIGERLPT